MANQLPIKIGIIQFPGTNCEVDTHYVCNDVYGMQSDLLWHANRLPKNHDYQCLILPGGFSYGDYLRAGSMAILSPVIDSVVEFAAKGGLLLGICNGMQVLTEMKLLPGAMLTNNTLNFECVDVYLKLESNNNPFTCSGKVGQILKMPIAHQQGCYYIDDAGLKELENNQQILFRYCDRDGKIAKESNPNGSLANIAGLCNKKGNVMGLMPHPERCAEKILGNDDGKIIFESIRKTLS